MSAWVWQADDDDSASMPAWCWCWRNMHGKCHNTTITTLPCALMDDNDNDGTSTSTMTTATWCLWKMPWWHNCQWWWWWGGGGHDVMTMMRWQWQWWAWCDDGSMTATPPPPPCPVLTWQWCNAHSEDDNDDKVAMVQCQWQWENGRCQGWADCSTTQLAWWMPQQDDDKVGTMRRLEFKSPVQSNFFAFFGRGPDWTTFGSLGMVHGPLKDWSKAVATSFQKDRSKTTKKPVQTTKKAGFFAFYWCFSHQRCVR